MQIDMGRRRGFLAATLAALLVLVSGVAEPPPPSPPPSPPAYVVTGVNVEGYTVETFRQAQVDALLDVLSNRMAVAPGTLGVVGFGMGTPPASAVAMQVQVTTTQVQAPTVSSVLSAFLGTSATAVAAFRAGGLSSTTGVGVVTEPITTNTAAPSLYAHSVAMSPTSDTVKYALIGVFGALAVSLVACVIIASCTPIGRRSGGRPKLDRLEAVGARAPMRRGSGWHTSTSC